MGCDPVDIGKTIHPHPTLCESIGMAAEVFEGVCTDLPPAKKEIAASRLRDVPEHLGEDMMEEQLRRDALEYHRVPTFGKNLRHANQEPDESARPGARLFAWRCLCVPCHPG